MTNYTKRVIGAQGEITIFRIIGDLPEGLAPHNEKDSSGRPIISHSESGSHHVLTGGTVLERTDNVPAGMQVLYALLDEPASLIQDADVPHGGYDLEPGIYEMRISREYDPFAEEARRVAD